MRGGADGVGPSTPQLIPATIFRKNFEFIAKIKPHEVPNRPELYMLGSCVTQEFLTGLTIGATCTHEDYREPCFTTEEIAEATTQLNVEKATYSEFTAEEIAEHTAQGGCAPPQPGMDVLPYVPTVDIASCTANNQQNEFRPDRDT